MRTHIARQFPLLITALLFFALVFIVFSHFGETQSIAATDTGYETNDAGLTYGVAEGGVFADSAPDLIGVIATNGEEGYAYRTELLQAIEPDPPSSPEEAVQLMQDRWHNAALAFAVSVEQQTGTVLPLGADQVANTIASLFETSGGELPFSDLSDTNKAALLNILPNLDASEEVASEALRAAYASNDVSIPVYKSDGQTRIGEFIVT
jgi:hypothetical protein